MNNTKKVLWTIGIILAVIIIAYLIKGVVWISSMAVKIIWISALVIIGLIALYGIWKSKKD
ncbi:hypothetical protein QYZ87_01050 [Porphyromonadaceae bacterium W3.11]|nr:hypothetical protein [Porphyromonadaceae bacterium W3.11]